LKFEYFLIIVSVLVFSYLIYDSFEIDYLYKNKYEIEVVSGDFLELIDYKEKVKLPHLNIRGIIKSISKDNVLVELSEKSGTFLKSRFIKFKTDDIMLEKLKEKNDVFLKLHDINLEGNILNYEYIEIYKYTENIDKENIKEESFYVPNDFGGIMKYVGTTFTYKNNRYFENNNDLSEDGKIYFVDIYTDTLLIEEYKNLFIPRKWYNMVNPQETYFDIIYDIYLKKEL